MRFTRRSGQRRWWWLSGIAFGISLAALVLWLLTLKAGSLSRVDQMASAVGGFAALASLLVSVIALAIAMRPTRTPESSSAVLRKAAIDLSAEVHRQWVAEAMLRHVRQPMPLRVCWSSTGRPVAAGRDAVLDEPVRADWQQHPLKGDVDEIVSAFRGLPHRQLVVLGEPGAGKSILALLMTLLIIEEPEEDQPVPVLLPITSWNPMRERVDDFIIRRLGEEYEFLAARKLDGRTLAALLVAQGKVLPVLDGLDELPTEWHSRAVEALDRLATADRPLVVTCRGNEYERAVVGSGSVLSRAAVVENEPVSIEQAIAFLSHPAPTAPRWQPVFEHLRQHPDGALGKVFSTPLMVSLARTAYWAPTTRPTALLKLPSRDAIAGSLIDQFVTSRYNAEQPPLPMPSQPIRVYDPIHAERWLTYLAYHLHQTGSRDLWWWQLSPSLLPPMPAWAKTITSVVAMLIAVAAARLCAPLIGGWESLLGATMAVTAIVGLNSAGAFRSIWPGGYPPYVALRYRTAKQRRKRRILAQLAFGIISGLLTGFLVRNLALGLIGGATCAVIAIIVPSWPVPIASRQSTPRLTLKANRRNAAAVATQYGLIGGTVFAALGGLTQWGPSALISGSAAALVYAFAAAFGAGLWTSTRYRLAHIRLATRGQLPWRLWTFLDDAHRRGILRQAGTAWQFRHALVQERLARRIHPELMRAEEGDRNATEWLIDLLAEHGRIDEIRTRADAGNWSAGQRLIDLLAEHGRIDEAIALLRPRANAGHPPAERELARHLAQHGLVDELRTRADAGSGYAARQLARHLAQHGRIDEAADLLRPRADAGDWFAAEQLASLLAQDGRIDEATDLLRPRADAGHPPAERELARHLAQHGRIDELRTRADAGDWFAAEQLAHHLAHHARIDEAITVLRTRADAGDPSAAEQLARLLVEHGRIDEAINVLRTRADASNRSATKGLGVLRTKHVEPDSR